MPSEPATVDSKEDVFGEIPTVKSRFKSGQSSVPARDLSYESALRNIRDIVSEKDKRWIDKQLAHPTPQDLDRRISRWKEQHGKTSA
jgi:hypothetical protein